MTILTLEERFDRAMQKGEMQDAKNLKDTQDPYKKLLYKIAVFRKEMVQKKEIENDK